MRTIIITAEETNSYVSRLTEAAQALREGALVVFPTETVYGVGANATNSAAVMKLREIKARAGTQPFTVHLGARKHARRFLSAPTPLFRRLARKGWPGPLTLIGAEPRPEDTEIAQRFPAAQLGEIYHDGQIGLRCPDQADAARLICESDVPVVASSANRSGTPPPFDLHEALRGLEGQVAYAIDAGRTRHNAASTIVDVSRNSFKILRLGAVDERTIERLARSEVLFVCTGNSCRSPMAEHLFRHELTKRLSLSIESLAAAGYHVSSAGTLGIIGASASSGALEEMARRGIDVGEHYSQALTAELVQRAERVYCMSPEHRRAVLDLAPGAASRVALLDPAGPVADPIGGGAEEYRACAEHIERALSTRLEEYLNEDRDW
ncbi:MAG: threonylcarbamoyl-AMP synthase [Phycisphaerae bacterium]|nr:threonylcarbamoyl-AMP synthase [Phycisphaerae bacterium]